MGFGFRPIFEPRVKARKWRISRGRTTSQGGEGGGGVCSFAARARVQNPRDREEAPEQEILVNVGT